MTDYTKTTDFAAKDALSSGDPNKVVVGTEIDDEFNNIATAVATKSNTVSPTFTGTLTAPIISATTSLTLASGATVTAILDDDTMATASATTLATSESVKAYVDTQLATQDALSEVLATGNTTGANNIIVTAGQSITTDTINETTAAAGVTIDSVLLKDGGITATGGGSLTGTWTDLGSVTTVDINGGTVDGVTIGGASAGAITGTTITANTSLALASGATVTAILDEDTMASDSATALATQQSIKAYVDTQLATQDALSEVLATGNTTGANNIVVTAGQSLTADNIAETTAASGVTIDSVLLKDGGITLASGVAVSSILDEDTMTSNSATALATQQSIKAYVDTQLATQDTLAEVLTTGNSSGGTDIVVTAGDVITVDTINETTSASGVTIDTVLLKDGIVTATATDAGTTTVLAPAVVTRTTSGTPATGIGAGVDFVVETSASNNETGMQLQAVTTDVTATTEDFDFVVNLMTAGATAAEKFRVASTGVVTMSGGQLLDSTGAISFDNENLSGSGTLSFTGGGSLTGTWTDLGTVTTVDINGGTVDGVTIGGASAGAGTFTTLNATGGGALTGTWTDLGSVTTVDINGGTIDGATIGGASAGAGTFTTLAGTTSVVAASDMTITSGSIVSASGAISFGNENLSTTGTLASGALTVTGAVLSNADDGGALGASGTGWSDLFLASGGVINWNAGDVTATHSANTLAFAGASSGYTFDAVMSDDLGELRQLPTPDAAKTTSYSLDAGDVGVAVLIGSGGSITIPDATLAADDVISLVNQTAGGITITCSITTAYVAGADVATATLSAYGTATIVFTSGTVCHIVGDVS